MTEKLQNKKSSKKLSLKNDIIFKAFFSKKENEKYLEKRKMKNPYWFS